MYIPQELYSQEILKTLKHLVIDKELKCCCHIDRNYKDQLYAYAVQALNYDIDIFLSQKSLKSIAHYIIKMDHDEYLNFYYQVKEDMFNHFSEYFDQMMKEIIDDIEQEKIFSRSESA